MAQIQIKKAVKAQSKLRLALIGISGSGKTYSALSIAHGLGQRVLVIDTEHGSASKYAGEDFEFDVIELEEFDPRNYIAAINLGEIKGYDVIVIDSLSHAWSGKGGALELVDQFAKRSNSSNNFSAWRDVTPLHNQLIDAIVGCKAHVIATMRSKTEYVQDKDERGKTRIRKVGMAPVQRDQMEYEFDVVGDMTDAHELIVTKSRCKPLADKVFPLPGENVANLLNDWLNAGAPAPEVRHCNCGVEARYVQGRSGNGWVCGHTPARCDFKLKDGPAEPAAATAPEPTEAPRKPARTPKPEPIANGKVAHPVATQGTEPAPAATATIDVPAIVADLVSLEVFNSPEFSDFMDACSESGIEFKSSLDADRFADAATTHSGHLVTVEGTTPGEFAEYAELIRAGEFHF